MNAPPLRARWAVALFAIALLVVTAWVAANDGAHAATARHFLRALLRQLF